MEIGIYLKPLAKWWRLLAISTAIAVFSSALAAFLQPPVYVARTTLMTGRAISNLNPDAGQIYIAQQLAAVYADIAMREPVQEATMKVLGIDKLPEYTAIVVPNTQLVEISVTDTVPERAQAIAAELANQLILQGPSASDTEVSQRQEFIKQQLSGLQAQIEETENRIEELQSSLATVNSASQRAYIESQINGLSVKLNDMRTAYAGLLYNTYSGALNNLTIVEPANLPSRSVGVNKLLIIGLAALVGLSLGAGAAYALEYLDKTIKTTTDVENVLKIPVIGYLLGISENGNNATYVLDHPDSVLAESFRLLQSNLEFFGIDNPTKTILVTSPSQGNGKTTVAVNLALLMNQGEQKVILVDADMRRPAVHKALSMSKAPGLSEMIRNHKGPHSMIQSWKRDNLEVLTAGSTPPNVTEVVGSRRIGSILDDLKENFEVVIIDAPPLVISDAYNLASKVDGVILIMEPGQTREEHVKAIKEQLDRAGAKLIGVVFNKVSPSLAKSNGDHQYLSLYSPQHYNDYVSDEARNEKKQPELSSKKLLAFFEHGEIPAEVTTKVEKAITAIRTQPRNLFGGIRKGPKKK